MCYGFLCGYGNVRFDFLQIICRHHQQRFGNKPNMADNIFKNSVPFSHLFFDVKVKISNAFMGK